MAKLDILDSSATNDSDSVATGATFCIITKADKTRYCLKHPQIELLVDGMVTCPACESEFSQKSEKLQRMKESINFNLNQIEEQQKKKEEELMLQLFQKESVPMKAISHSQLSSAASSSALFEQLQYPTHHASISNNTRGILSYSILPSSELSSSALTSAKNFAEIQVIPTMKSLSSSMRSLPQMTSANLSLQQYHFETYMMQMHRMHQTMEWMLIQKDQEVQALRRNLEEQKDELHDRTIHLALIKEKMQHDQKRDERNFGRDVSHVEYKQQGLEVDEDAAKLSKEALSTQKLHSNQQPRQLSDFSESTVSTTNFTEKSLKKKGMLLDYHDPTKTAHRSETIQTSNYSNSTPMLAMLATANAPPSPKSLGSNVSAMIKKKCRSISSARKNDRSPNPDVKKPNFLQRHSSQHKCALKSVERAESENDSLCMNQKLGFPTKIINVHDSNLPIVPSEEEITLGTTLQNDSSWISLSGGDRFEPKYIPKMSSAANNTSSNDQENLHHSIESQQQDKVDKNNNLNCDLDNNQNLAISSSSMYDDEEEDITLQHVNDKTIIDVYGEIGIYTGYILKSTGMPHGEGKMIMMNNEDNKKVYYEGEWRHGCLYGF